MSVPRNIFGQLAEVIIEGGARQAIKYLSPTEVVKATAILYKGRKHDRREKHRSILFTLGVPGYREQESIKRYKQAGEPFPVKKIQIRWPKKK